MKDQNQIRIVIAKISSEYGDLIEAVLMGHPALPEEGARIATISGTMIQSDRVLWNDFKNMLRGAVERISEEICGEAVRIYWDLPSEIQVWENLPPVPNVSI